VDLAEAIAFQETFEQLFNINNINNNKINNNKHQHQQQQRNGQIGRYMKKHC
jgi:hypothetical protein